MDNIEALLLRCCDQVELSLVDFGRGTYRLLTTQNLALKKRIEVLDILILRIREYIFLRLLKQAQRLLCLAQVLCKEIKILCY